METYTASDVNKEGSAPPVAPPQRPVKRRRPGRRKRIIKNCLAVLVVLALCGALAWLTYYVFFSPPPEYYLTGDIEIWDGKDDKPANIKNVLTGYGYFQPESSESVLINQPGVVLQSNLWYEAQVNEGDVLVVMDSSSIDKAVAEHYKQIEAIEQEIDGIYTQIGKSQEQIEKIYGYIANANQQYQLANAKQLAMKEAARIAAPFSGRIEEAAELPVGSELKEGQYMGLLVDDTQMRLSLTFSYGYINDITLGQSCNVSIPSAMTSIKGTVTNIDSARRVNADGSMVFLVDFTIDNPGALLKGAAATATLTAADGEMILPAEAGTLEYVREMPMFSETVGTIKTNNLRSNYVCRQGDLLLEVVFEMDPEIEEQHNEIIKGFQNDILVCEETIQGYEDSILQKEEQILLKLEDIDREYERMDDLTFLSPLSGTVVNYVELWPGMTVSETSPVQVDIANLDTLTLRGEIYQADVQKVHVGMTVDVDAYVDGEMTTIPGTLTAIDKTANQTGGAAYYPVVISVDNSQRLLMVGSGANFYVTLEISEAPIVVPNNAVKPAGNNEYVFLQPKDGVRPESAVDLPGDIVPPGFYAIPVKTGIVNSRYVEITEGLLREWEGWKVFTQKTDVIPSPSPSYDDVDPSSEDFRKGYNKGWEDRANASPEPTEDDIIDDPILPDDGWGVDDPILPDDNWGIEEPVFPDDGWDVKPIEPGWDGSDDLIIGDGTDGGDALVVDDGADGGGLNEPGKDTDGASGDGATADSGGDSVWDGGDAPDKTADEPIIIGGGVIDVLPMPMPGGGLR